MEIVIRIIVQTRGIRSMSAGSFLVNQRLFREDANKEAAKVAYQWIKQVKKEMDVDVIEKVIYNGDNDITELVRELQRSPIN